MARLSTRGAAPCPLLAPASLAASARAGSPSGSGGGGGGGADWRGAADRAGAAARGRREVVNPPTTESVWPAWSLAWRTAFSAWSRPCPRANSPITLAAAASSRPFAASCGIVSRAENRSPSGAKTKTSRACSMGFLWLLTVSIFSRQGRAGEIPLRPFLWGGVDDHDVGGCVVRDLVRHAPEDEAFRRGHTLRADDDHVGARVARGVDQKRRRVATLDAQDDVVDAHLMGDAPCPAGPFLGARGVGDRPADVLGRSLEPLGLIFRPRCERRHNREPCVEGFGQLGRMANGELSGLRTIGANDDVAVRHEP